METIRFSETVNTNVMPYFLGLDIGTNSVGWAITDKNYRIIKKNGKALWGSRLFKEAQPAAVRRGFRSARRRRKRTRTRIKLLQEYFSDAISSIDPGFYQRLKDSFFVAEDKETAQYNTLFSDTNFKDKDYHEQFPTIYHLRRHLMDSSAAQDPRLVYLACHHIMKNRGNFLIEGNLSTEMQLDSSLEALQNYWVEESEDALWPADQLGEVAQVLLSKKQNASDKAKTLQRMLLVSEKNTKEICKLVAGNSAKLSNLFDDPELDESEVKSVKFSDGSFDNEDVRNSLESSLGDRKELLDLAFGLYSAALLQKLLQGSDGKPVRSISEARIKIFEMHAEDLRQLKDLIRTLSKIEPKAKDLYSRIFRDNQKGLHNYVAYSGHVDSKDTTSPITRCNQEEFYKFLKKELDPYKEYENIADILEEIDQEVYLPKISSSSNGIIPHQLHGMELEKILRNSQAHLSFLTEDVIMEIIQIFNFRIPYYVGPFDNRSQFAWLTRKSNEPIRPWNLHEVIDVEATAEQFIRNLTNKCTYLIGEDVLPKESLLYSEYMVRNAINTLTVDGHRLDKAVRDHLYEDLFVRREKGGRITKKRVVSALNRQGLEVTEHSLGGMDLDIPAKLKAKKDFSAILHNELSDEEIESIIEKITAFPDSPEMVRNYVQAQFGERLNSEQIDRIAHFSYKDWGRLSRKLLAGIKHEGPDSRRRSIIEIMREEALNLMEILDESRYSFTAKIKEHNEGLLDDPNTISEEYLEALRLSPAVKKAVRQVLLICKELFGIMQGVPERIFIEMARQEEEKKRTTSRKQQLASLYASCKEDADVWSQELQEMPEDRFKSKKLFLYCMQRGRCMYSGERIHIEELFDNSKYDIDHIYPRSLTKDDSWNNLVLVKQDLNRSKSNKALDESIQRKNYALWHGLLQCGFLTEEKFKRLTRKEPLSADELTSFINRQLVETRQSTKSLAEIFKRVLPTSEVVYVKAGLVSDFRYNDGTRNDAKTEFYFPKVRSLNDFHHAKDAYLNIVVGNAYHVTFTKNFFLNLQQVQHPQYNLVKYFDREIREKNHVVWKPGEDGTIRTVKQMMNRNNILLSHEATRNTGGFFDQMIVKKGGGQHSIKGSLPALQNLKRYGGFNKVSGSHFCVIRHQKGKKFEVSFLAVPILLRAQKFSTESLIAYFESQGYENISILCPEIKYGSVIEYNGVRYRVKAKSGSKIKCAPAVQASYTLENEVFLKEIERTIKVETINFDDGFNCKADAFFVALCERLNSLPFCSYDPLNGQGEKLVKFADRFFLLDISRKCKQITAITQLLNGSGESVDLSAIYTEPGSKTTGTQSGTLFITINDKNKSTLNLINSSITGYFQNKREVF